MHGKLLVIAALATGCAATLKSKQAPLAVSSATPGAEVYVDGQKVGVTPTSVQLTTTSEHVITVKGGGKEETCRVATAASGGWIVLDILLTGGIGLIIDYATHDWNNLDKTSCSVSV
jgi:hypothetical protein